MSFVYNIHVNSLVCWVSALWTFQLIHPTSLDFVWRPPAQGGECICVACATLLVLFPTQKKSEKGVHTIIYLMKTFLSEHENVVKMDAFMSAFLPCHIIQYGHIM